MKKIGALMLLAGAVAAPLAHAAVGVSIGVAQPGVYGRIDIGNYPQPTLVLPQPVVIVPPPVFVQRQPIYLYVPPRHQQNWGRYCGQYNACNQPVYFVQDQWVRERYEHEHPGWRGDHDKGRGRGFDRDDRDDDRGNGRGKGRGRGHGD